MIGAGQCRIPDPFDPQCIWGAEDFLCLRFFDMPSCWINGLDGVYLFREHRKRIPSLPGVSRNCLQKMLLPPLNALHISSTAQGGGGSFKNRKPIGETGCCESGMAKRSH